MVRAEGHGIVGQLAISQQFNQAQLIKPQQPPNFSIKCTNISLFSVAHDGNTWLTEDTPTKENVACPLFCLTTPADPTCASDTELRAAMLQHSESFATGCLKKDLKSDKHRSVCEKIDPSLTRDLEEEEGGD